MDYENAIEIRNLTKRYDGFALDNISFDVPKGSIMGYIGQNGAGKTTTIFSKGMKMKLQIAAGLSHKAKLLIMDEDNSILMSSHITSDLEKIADRVTFIDKGKILLTGVKDELLDNHGVVK